MRIGQFTLLRSMARKGLIGCRCHVLICTSTDLKGDDDDTPLVMGFPILRHAHTVPVWWLQHVEDWIFFWYLTWCQIPICLHGVKPLTSINMH